MFVFLIDNKNPSQPPPTTNSRGAARSGEPDAKRVKEALELHTHKNKKNRKAARRYLPMLAYATGLHVCACLRYQPAPACACRSVPACACPVRACPVRARLRPHPTPSLRTYKRMKRDACLFNYSFESDC
jgi:hypothetical protein